MSGTIQTVLGALTPADLGVTLTHEHLSLTFDVSYVPANPQDKANEDYRFKKANLGWIRQNPYSHKENLRMNEEQEAVLQEMKTFKSHGGRSIVENTTLGITRDVEFLKRLSQESGVNIIAGAGYYVAASHPSNMSSRTIEDLTTELVREVRVGVDDTGIKCGVIGEIGCSWPLHENEKKVLRATAAAQTDTGCPVIIHPGRHPTAPAEIIRVLQEAGGDITRTVMSHLDRTIADVETLLEFAALGSYCEFDLFGVETSHYMMDEVFDMPSDAQRIQNIKHLIDAGYLDRFVMGHDIHTKHRLTKYGGHGYSHILVNVVPKMLKRNITQADIDRILVDNPRAWLTFK